MPRGQYDRSKTQKPFRQAEEVPARPDLPVEAPPAPAPDIPAEASGAPWVESRRRPIDEAPLTGETIWLFSDTHRSGIQGRWRVTRKFARGRWVVSKIWACPLTHKSLGDTWIEWEPLK